MTWIPLRVKAMWMAFPAAPEDRQLRLLRRWSMGLCLSASLTIALVDRIAAIHPLLVLVVGTIAVAAIGVTTRYWFRKQRIDTDYQAALYEAEVLKARGGKEI